MGRRQHRPRAAGGRQGLLRLSAAALPWRRRQSLDIRRVLFHREPAGGEGEAACGDEGHRRWLDLWCAKRSAQECPVQRGRAPEAGLLGERRVRRDTSSDAGIRPAACQGSGAHVGSCPKLVSARLCQLDKRTV